MRLCTNPPSDTLTHCHILMTNESVQVFNLPLVKEEQNDCLFHTHLKVQAHIIRSS